MLFSRRSRGRGSFSRLTECMYCGSGYVCPVEWTARDETYWWIRLRCGECGEVREVVVSQELADRYDAALDRGTDVIATTLSRLERERMSAEVETFTRALELDLLDAGDFA